MWTGSIFTAVLTGSADNTSNLDLPCSSIEALFRKNTLTFLSVVTNADLITDINNRSNGEIVIYKTHIIDGVKQTPIELGRANLGDIRLDYGARSKALTLTGTKSLFSFYSSTASVAIKDVSFINTLDSGNHEITLSPENDVLPGEAATFNGDTYTVEQLHVSANANQVTYKIKEVEL